MRVGFLSSSYPRFDGDHAGCFVRELALAVAARGHEVEVCAPWDGESPRHEGSNGLRVRRFRVTPPGVRSQLFYGDGAPENLSARAVARAEVPAAATAFLVQAAAHASRWDTVVSHWLAPAGLAAAAVRRMGGPRHVCVLHGGDVDWLGATALGRALSRAAGRGLDAALPVSRSVEARARALLGDGAAPPMRLLPLPGATPLQRPRPTEARRALGLPGNVGVVLFLGRLGPIKGAGILVAAAAKVPGVRLVIAGPGEGAHLAAAAERLGVDLVLTGPADAAQREVLFSAADLLAVPSLALGYRSEGLPQVAREAVARGVPLVAASTGGLPEAVAESAGLLFEPGDPADLARAMRRVLDDRAGWRRRARAAARSELRPTWAAAARIVEQAMEGAQGER